MSGIFQRFACALIGHKYVVHQVFTPESRRICCDRCGGDWAMNDRERIVVPWDGSFHEMYENVFGIAVKPKLQRKRMKDKRNER